MPGKSARKRRLEKDLEKAREAKMRKSEEQGASASCQTVDGIHDIDHEDASVLLMSEDAIDTDDDAVDPDFDLDSSIRSDPDHIIDSFCEDWVAGLDRDDRMSLGLFLYFQLKQLMKIGATEAAELAGMLTGKSDKTIREWRDRFFQNDGTLPEAKQGKYQRSGIVWTDEALNMKAMRFIRENACVKGKPNLTVHKFCEWVNEDLLPNETIEPGFPRKISVETSRKWMHNLGFEVVIKKKGTFVDGHERQDVVDYRNSFLRKMAGIGFLNPLCAPTESAKNALPSDLEYSRPDLLEKTVVLFHDETTFQSNEDQTTLWASKGTKCILPKSRGSGIMISDFISEKDGYLGLTDSEYEAAKQKKPNSKKYARQWLEYGEAKEGYWTSQRFLAQMKEAIEIANFKYPKEDGWRVVWIFDHSSCHAAMPDDALDVGKMNVNPGGKQRVMCDGWWGGKPQKMNYSLGVPKGLRVVLDERGVNTRGLNADRMREILKEHPDFKNQKSALEVFLEENGHLVYLLPKYHCELNPIERVWAQAKRYARAYCKYSIVGLRKTINPALDSVELESIQKHFRKVKHYMFAYLEGLPGGSDLENLVKVYKKEVKSHRRISELQ